MKIEGVPYLNVDWEAIPEEIHRGESGIAKWKTFEQGNIRARIVELSPGYLADHWCWRGHVLLCLEGELDTELEDGRQFTLTAGMSYQVGNDMEAHRSSTRVGAKLFIVD